MDIKKIFEETKDIDQEVEALRAKKDRILRDNFGLANHDVLDAETLITLIARMIKELK